MKKCIASCVFMGVFTLSAQVNTFEPVTPDSKLIPARNYPEEAGKKYNPEPFYNHPDFGKLTFFAPYGKNVVEDISKRTADSRYYIDLDNPTYFYIEQASNAINTYQDGYWRAIDPTLHKTNETYYESGVQPCPTALDLTDKNTSIRIGEEHFTFNHFSLKIIHNDHSVTEHPISWDQIAIGNEGAYITDAFPGIDMKLTFRQGKIKSEFIIRENLHVQQLVFTDHLTIPSNLNGFIYTPSNIPAYKPVIFEDITTGEAVVKISPARCHDNSGNKRSWINPYILNGNLLDIVCDSAQLNDPAMVYPITVDPLVTVVGPISSANSLMGSLPSPSSCSNTLNVTFPGGTTPWDVSAYWDIETNFCSDDYIDYWSFVDCWMSEAQVWITTPCGGISPVGAPGTIWTCSGAGCSTYGTWNPTLPFSTSGTQSLAQCFTPSCSNQTMSFTINSNRSYCSNYYGYDNCNYASNSCNIMNSWRVTVQGRNAETLSNTLTGNGSTTIAAPTCASGTTVLNPTPQYGVPGYSYLWNTGQTSATINPANGPATYTCQVTDACGTVRTASFVITCPLGANMYSFEATNSGSFVILDWITASEQDNTHFEILRAGSDFIFSKIGEVAGHGNSDQLRTYQFIDSMPLQGTSYYQISSVNTNGETELSAVRSIQRTLTTAILAVVPNPNNGQFSLHIPIPETGIYFVEIISSIGRVLYQTEYALDKGSQVLSINKPVLDAGTYMIRVRNGNQEMVSKMIVN